jgi:hypothetical protein
MTAAARRRRRKKKTKKKKQREDQQLPLIDHLNVLPSISGVKAVARDCKLWDSSLFSMGR